MEFNPASPHDIKRILDKFCLHPHKKWGQNFLMDSNIINKILKEVDLKSEDNIIEIGPGLGALTMPLVKGSAMVAAIEIDRGLINFLNEFLASYENKKIIEGDIRKVDIVSIRRSVFGKEDTSYKYVANLPYYITSPFIYRLISEDFCWSKAVLMVQKEVASRLLSLPGSADYGALSVLCRFFTKSRLAFSVSPGVFFPPPRVESAVVVIEPRIERECAGDDSLLIKLVSGVFRHRRKTISNSLSLNFGYDRHFSEKIIKEAGISPGKRPDALHVAEFAKLCRLIYNNSDKN